MEKLLLYNYSLSVYFSRGQKDLFRKGTWFLFANELFFISVSLTMIIITRFNYKMPGWITLFLLFFIWYFIFYGTKKWLFSQIDTKGIEKIHQELGQTTFITFKGFFLFVGSFLFFCLIAIATFQGYLNR